MALVPVAPGPLAAGGAEGHEEADPLEQAVANFLCAGELRDRLLELRRQRPLSGASCRNAPLVVDAMCLLDAVPEVYPFLRDWPRLVEFLQNAAAAAASRLVPAVATAAGADGTSGPAAVAPTASPALRVRLARVPGPDFARPSVSQLRVSDRGHFVKFLGTVTRAGAAKVVQEWREFRCESCGDRFRLRASPESSYDFELPAQCRSGEKKTAWDSKAKRPKTMKCHSKAFQQLPHGDDSMADFQEVRVQDQMQALEAGVVPQSVTVSLFGDLVGRIQPGDTVLIEGVVWQRWRGPWMGKRLELELFVEATHAERVASSSLVRHAAAPSPGQRAPEGSDPFLDFWARHQQDEWRARAELVQATAPWLSGLPVPKLALLLALIGGVPSAATAVGAPGSLAGDAADGVSRWARFRQPEPEQQQPVAAGQAADGAAAAGENAATGAAGQLETVRTTPHLLLLGDPGTGKSQLLQAAQELGGRSVRTSGLGCTNAGLTCAAVREGPDFVLEAGALVLADGGVCCIDEFSTIRSHDRAAVHEAMEQQTVSVAKAGLVCRLRSQCSVIAAQNCKGGSSRGRGASYDRGASLVVNSGLPPPLLSRFDLVVVFAGGGKGAATEQDKADFIISATSPSKGKRQGDAAQGPEGAPETGAGSAAAAADDGGGGSGPAAAAAAAGASGDWTHSKLRDYVAWAKENPLPEAPAPRAQEVLERYFMKLRADAMHGGGAGGGITVRTFQSLWRLSQAHARLMHHRCVQLEDAVAVVVLHRAALQDHVVGAEASGGEGGDFAPSLPDLEGEVASCSVRGSSSHTAGVDLHHGTDIPDRETYRQWEAWVLRYLARPAEPPRPILDAPSGDEPPPGVVAGLPPGPPPPSESGSGWAGHASQGSAGGSPGNGSQGQATQRGRRLGCRFR